MSDITTDSQQSSEQTESTTTNSIKKELFFPTPVYYVDIEGGEALNQYLKTRIYAWRDADLDGIQRSNARTHGSWHSATTMNQRQEYGLFKNKVDLALTEVFRDQYYNPAQSVKCHNMWANINPPGGYNRGHTHPGSLWSGVYYVQAPEACGQVIFQDPRAPPSPARGGLHP